jgi:hypothetical protein
MKIGRQLHRPLPPLNAIVTDADGSIPLRTPGGYIFHPFPLAAAREGINAIRIRGPKYHANRQGS